jgi:hypothetical protein
MTYVQAPPKTDLSPRTNSKETDDETPPKPLAPSAATLAIQSVDRNQYNTHVPSFVLNNETLIRLTNTKNRDSTFWPTRKVFS